MGRTVVDFWFVAVLVFVPVFIVVNFVLRQGRPREWRKMKPITARSPLLLRGLGTCMTLRARLFPWFSVGGGGFAIDIDGVQACFAQRTIMFGFPTHATLRGVGE